MVSSVTIFNLARLVIQKRQRNVSTMDCEIFLRSDWLRVVELSFLEDR